MELAEGHRQGLLPLEADAADDDDDDSDWDSQQDATSAAAEQCPTLPADGDLDMGGGRQPSPAAAADLPKPEGPHDHLAAVDLPEPVEHEQHPASDADEVADSAAESPSPIEITVPSTQQASAAQVASTLQDPSDALADGDEHPAPAAHKPVDPLAENEIAGVGSSSEAQGLPASTHGDHRTPSAAVLEAAGKVAAESPGADLASDSAFQPQAGDPANPVAGSSAESGKEESALTMPAAAPQSQAGGPASPIATAPAKPGQDGAVPDVPAAASHSQAEGPANPIAGSSAELAEGTATSVLPAMATQSPSEQPTNFAASSPQVSADSKAADSTSAAAQPPGIEDLADSEEFQSQYAASNASQGGDKTPEPTAQSPANSSYVGGGDGVTAGPVLPDDGRSAEMNTSSRLHLLSGGLLLESISSPVSPQDSSAPKAIAKLPAAIPVLGEASATMSGTPNGVNQTTEAGSQVENAAFLQGSEPPAGATGSITPNARKVPTASEASALEVGASLANSFSLQHPAPAATSSDSVERASAYEANAADAGACADLLHSSEARSAVDKTSAGQLADDADQLDRWEDGRDVSRQLPEQPADSGTLVAPEKTSSAESDAAVTPELAAAEALPAVLMQDGDQLLASATDKADQQGHVLEHASHALSHSENDQLQASTSPSSQADGTAEKQERVPDSSVLVKSPEDADEAQALQPLSAEQPDSDVRAEAAENTPSMLTGGHTGLPAQAHATEEHELVQGDIASDKLDLDMHPLQGTEGTMHEPEGDGSQAHTTDSKKQVAAYTASADVGVHLPAAAARPELVGSDGHPAGKNEGLSSRPAKESETLQVQDAWPSAVAASSATSEHPPSKQIQRAAAQGHQSPDDSPVHSLTSASQPPAFPDEPKPMQSEDPPDADENMDGWEPTADLNADLDLDMVTEPEGTPAEDRPNGASNEPTRHLAGAAIEPDPQLPHVDASGHRMTARGEYDGSFSLLKAVEQGDICLESGEEDCGANLAGQQSLGWPSQPPQTALHHLQNGGADIDMVDGQDMSMDPDPPEASPQAELARRVHRHAYFHPAEGDLDDLLVRSNHNSPHQGEGVVNTVDSMVVPHDPMAISADQIPPALQSPVPLVRAPSPLSLSLLPQQQPLLSSAARQDAMSGDMSPALANPPIDGMFSSPAAATSSNTQLSPVQQAPHESSTAAADPLSQPGHHALSSEQPIPMQQAPDESLLGEADPLSQLVHPPPSPIQLIPMQQAPNESSTAAGSPVRQSRRHSMSSSSQLIPMQQAPDESPDDSPPAENDPLSQSAPHPLSPTQLIPMQQAPDESSSARGQWARHPLSPTLSPRGSSSESQGLCSPSPSWSAVQRSGSFPPTSREPLGLSPPHSPADHSRGCSGSGSGGASPPSWSGACAVAERSMSQSMISPMTQPQFHMGVALGGGDALSTSTLTSDGPATEAGSGLDTPMRRSATLHRTSARKGVHSQIAEGLELPTRRVLSASEDSSPQRAEAPLSRTEPTQPPLSSLAAGWSSSPTSAAAGSPSGDGGAGWSSTPQPAAERPAVESPPTSGGAGGSSGKRQRGVEEANPTASTHSSSRLDDSSWEGPRRVSGGIHGVSLDWTGSYGDTGHLVAAASAAKRARKADPEPVMLRRMCPPPQPFPGRLLVT